MRWCISSCAIRFGSMQTRSAVSRIRPADKNGARSGIVRSSFCRDSASSMKLVAWCIDEISTLGKSGQFLDRQRLRSCRWMILALHGDEFVLQERLAREASGHIGLRIGTNRKVQRPPVEQIRDVQRAAWPKFQRHRGREFPDTRNQGGDQYDRRIFIGGDPEARLCGRGIEMDLARPSQDWALCRCQSRSQPAR